MCFLADVTGSGCAGAAGSLQRVCWFACPVVADSDWPGRPGGAAGRVGEDGRMGVIRFTAQLQPRGPAAAVVLDDAQVAAVGEGARRFPVVATVNGYTWRTTVARRGASSCQA